MSEMEKTQIEGEQSSAWDELAKGPDVAGETAKAEDEAEAVAEVAPEKEDNAAAEDGDEGSTTEKTDGSNGSAEEDNKVEVKTAEYYRNNPKEISGMVAKLIQMRGGVDGAEGIVWDDTLKARVDKNGLPIEWMRLSKYLRSNPDKLSIIVEEYNHLSGADTLVETDKAPEDGGDISEEDMRDDDEVVNEGAEAVKVPAEVIDFAENRTKVQIEHIDDSINKVANFQQQSEVWKKISEALDDCSDDVKNEMKFLRAEDALKNSKDSLQGYKDRLKRMPTFTLPWSKRGQAKAALKQMIETSSRSVKHQETEVAKLKENLPKVMLDKDNETVVEFRRLDARMARLNDDLHTREYIKDINMRKNWIAGQQQFMTATSNGERVLDDTSDAARRDAIRKWQNEITDFQNRIRKYQAEHPDFELYPGEARQRQMAQGADVRKAA